MTNACIVGSTGLVGSHLLSILLNSSTIHSVCAFSRKEVASTEKLRVIHNADSATWPSEIPLNTDIFFSALGTSARRAGGFANQRKVDYDLNVALAKAAKAKGVRIYVLISTTGANSSSMFPYLRMRGELDEAVKAIGFEHVVIVKPGLLVGTREDSRPGEFAARRLASFLGTISGNRLKDGWAQDADVVAKAALSAALELIHGKTVAKTVEVNQSDVVRLGRTDWQHRS